jgi:hypothetical protein
MLAIATMPARRPGRDEAAVVMLNTGIVHRIGHYRMYVTLSRRIAARGRIAARFDLSGIGDSLPRNDGTPPLTAAMQDIRVMLDWLQSAMGVNRVVLVGLCSGADHSVVYSHGDPRVVGLVLMDPSLPPTGRYYLHYVMQRLGRLDNWLSVLSGRSGLLRLLRRQFRGKRNPLNDVRGLTLENLPFSPFLRECYKEAAVRGTRLLTVFTVVSARHTYHQQILDAFPEVAARAALRLEYFGSSDHVFSDAGERERLYAAILDWLGLD